MGLDCRFLPILRFEEELRVTCSRKECQFHKANMKHPQDAIRMADNPKQIMDLKAPERLSKSFKQEK